MARFLISLVSLAAVATLAFGSAANACPRDAKNAKADTDCPCKKNHKTAAAKKAAPEIKSAPSAEKQTMRDLSPVPHVRMLDALSQPSPLKVPEQARRDASAGVFI